MCSRRSEGGWTSTIPEQPPLRRILRIFFGLLALTALGRQLAIHLGLGFDPVNFFSYYTILGNLFAGCVLLVSSRPTAQPVRSVELLRFISVVNMALVGIVFSTLLRNTDLGPLLPWVNFVHHYLIPCVVVIDWLAAPPRLRLGPRELLVSLAFPLLYLVYSLIRGQFIQWYPYPFLDARLVGGPGGVAAYVVAITVGFCVSAYALLAIGNRRRRTSL